MKKEWWSGGNGEERGVGMCFAWNLTNHIILNDDITINIVYRWSLHITEDFKSARILILSNYL